MNNKFGQFLVLGWCFLCVVLVISSCREEEDVLITPATKGFTLIENVSVVQTESVFGIPKVTLNYPIEKEVSIDENLFRPVLLEFKVLNDLAELPGQVVELNDGSILGFYSNELLPENSSLTATVTMAWEINKNNRWERIEDNLETKEYKFSTGSYNAPFKIVSAIEPDDQSVDQSLFISPFVLFSQDIAVPIVNDILRLRVVIDESRILLNGSDIDKHTILSQSKDTLIIVPDRILHPSSEFDIILKWHWEREVNGVWRPCMYNNEIRFEIVRQTFRTKAESSSLVTILHENIKYAYPIPYQYHFFKKEYGLGFLVLNSAKQNYLFDGPYNLVVRFSTLGFSDIEVPLTFDHVKNRINYSIPDGLLKEKIYKLQFIRRSVGSTSEEELYVAYFRTSMFDRFSEKISGMTFSITFNQFYSPLVFGLKVHVQDLEEYFDAFELESKPVTTPEGITVRAAVNLIRFEASLIDNDWYQNHVYPLLYAPWTDPTFKPQIKRDTSIVRFLPTNAMSIGISGDARKLTHDAIATNEAQSISKPSVTYFEYSLNPFFHSDFNAFQQQVLEHVRVKYPNNNWPTREKEFILGRTPYLRYRQHGYRILYVLPDNTITFTSEEFFMENLRPENLRPD